MLPFPALVRCLPFKEVSFDKGNRPGNLHAYVPIAKTGHKGPPIAKDRHTQRMSCDAVGSREARSALAHVTWLAVFYFEEDPSRKHQRSKEPLMRGKLINYPRLTDTLPCDEHREPEN